MSNRAEALELESPVLQILSSKNLHLQISDSQEAPTFNPVNEVKTKDIKFEAGSDPVTAAAASGILSEYKSIKTMNIAECTILPDSSQLVAGRDSKKDHVLVLDDFEVPLEGVRAVLSVTCWGEKFHSNISLFGAESGKLVACSSGFNSESKTEVCSEIKDARNKPVSLASMDGEAFNMFVCDGILMIAHTSGIAKVMLNRCCQEESGYRLRLVSLFCGGKYQGGLFCGGRYQGGDALRHCLVDSTTSPHTILSLLKPSRKSHTLVRFSVMKDEWNQVELKELFSLDCGTSDTDLIAGYLWPIVDKRAMCPQTLPYIALDSEGRIFLQNVYERENDGLIVLSPDFEVLSELTLRPDWVIFQGPNDKIYLRKGFLGENKEVIFISDSGQISAK
jgi:hypothetical protein